MNQPKFPPKNPTSVPYRNRTSEYYLNKINPQILSSLNREQIIAIREILDEAIPKHSPKIVDLRLTVDLIISRFYLVLLVGKERRKGQRDYPVTGITRIGNLIAATLLLIGINLLISLFIFLFLYLIKSALGINLLPGHLDDVLKKF
ncbi:hypothetical protein ACL6C3_25035 [Capilliphycus salinus ALCB114379]|uniref:hypothetical protein n=1 Tax=Capilliphycus salinus TaxID=2768948 RepID=UPI0039A454A1